MHVARVRGAVGQYWGSVESACCQCEGGNIRGQRGSLFGGSVRAHYLGVSEGVLGVTGRQQGITGGSAGDYWGSAMDYWGQWGIVGGSAGDYWGSAGDFWGFSVSLTNSSIPLLRPSLPPSVTPSPLSTSW